MSELVILCCSADETSVAPILKCLVELGIDAVANTTDGQEPLQCEQLLRNNLILICWSPALVFTDSTIETFSNAEASSKILSCTITPCQPPPPFGDSAIVSLLGWHGAAEASEWLTLVSQLGGMLQRPGLIELSRAFASGDEQDRYAFAKRYPDEPAAKEFWKHREIKHRQAFEHSLAFARANFDRRVRSEWKKIEDMLKVYKTEFEIWLEEERFGNSRTLPQPHLVTAEMDDNVVLSGEAEAKAGALADQLAREYSKRREFGERAARLELQLQQSEAEATLKLQIANRAIEAAYKQAQTVERENAAIVVERNILNHGQAALRSELARLRTSPRRYRILATIVIVASIASGSLTSRIWPIGQADPAHQDVVKIRSNAGSNIVDSNRMHINTAVTKESISTFMNEAMRIAPDAVLAALSRASRGDLLTGIVNEDLNAFVAQIVKAVPRQIIAEVVKVQPKEVVEGVVRSSSDLVASEIVKAAPEIVVRALLNDNADKLVTQVVANSPSAVVTELLRINPTALVATLSKNQTEMLVPEMLRSAPDAMVEGTVRAYPSAVAGRLLKIDTGPLISEIIKLTPDKLLAELLRANSNQVVTQLVRNFSGAIISEIIRADPNSVVSAALRLDPSHVIGEATRLAPDVVISEALRSNLAAVTLEGVRMAPASLINEIVRARPAELSVSIAKTYPDLVTAQLLQNSPETVVAEVLKTRPDLLTAKMASADPLVTSDMPKTALHRDSATAPPSDPSPSTVSELIKTGQSTTTNEEIAQVSSEAVKDIVNIPARLATLKTAVPDPSVNSDKKSIKDCDICPKLLTIPAGSNFIGLHGDEKLSGEISDRSSHGHPVYLPSPFALSESKITVGQFKSFMLERHISQTLADTCRGFAGRTAQRRAQLNYLSPGFEQDDSHPVVCVSWNDAIEYTHWLSERTGKRYRLPTEAEWEYAARGSSPDAWLPGESAPESCRYGNVLDASAVAKRAATDRGLAAPCSDQWAYTSPPGAFPANAFGLFDMYGNAHEWVQDCWNDDLSTLPADGTARRGENNSTECGTEMRVRRGSAWTTPPAASGLAARWKGTETHAFQDTGFRVLRDLD
jgi:sulfatase modifying factor 1